MVRLPASEGLRLLGSQLAIKYPLGREWRLRRWASKRAWQHRLSVDPATPAPNAPCPPMSRPMIPSMSPSMSPSMIPPMSPPTPTPRHPATAAPTPSHALPSRPACVAPCLPASLLVSPCRGSACLRVPLSICPRPARAPGGRRRSGGVSWPLGSGCRAGVGHPGPAGRPLWADGHRAHDGTPWLHRAHDGTPWLG